MSRPNPKQDELKKMAELIMDSEDYENALQKINGLRMGLTNKYNIVDESKFDNFRKIKRLTAWKNLLEAYK